MSLDIIIRKFVAEDVTNLITLFDESQPGAIAEDIEVTRQYLLDYAANPDSDTYFLAEMNGKLIGYILGGMLGVLSALIHKAANLLILYGWDLATLFDNLVIFASRQLGLQNFQGIEVLVLLGIIYMITGGVAALLALRIATRVYDGEVDPALEGATPVQNKLFQYTDPHDYSFVLLLMHVFSLAGILLAINLWPVWIWIPVSVVYLGFTWFHYRRSFRRLLRPRMWIQLLLITLLAAIFIKGIESGRFPDPEGVRAGLLMNLRAILLLTGFSAISTELKNPVVKAILYRRGFSSLYKSISLAFSVLPVIIATFPRKNPGIRGFSGLLRNLLLKSDFLYQRIRDLDERLPVCFILAGDREEGKTTFLNGLADKLKVKGITLSGFVAEGIHDTQGVRTGYQIKNCQHGESVTFCQTHGVEGWTSIGKFYIDPVGLQQGCRWLSKEAVGKSDLVIVDEMGPLELAGKGWADPIEKLITEYPKPMIWTVRRKLVKKLSRKWNLGQVIIWDLSSQTIDRASDQVVVALASIQGLKEHN